MNTFGISLFRQPEEFIALHAGMHTYTPLFLKALEKMLHRTKSPPIAVTYTYHFLRDKTEDELSLDVIRFVSQLADLSPGVSMSSSLHNILDQSSFLTELRHSLTHKTMVKGSILLLSRKMIIDELQQKYWKVTTEKLIQTYGLREDKVRQYFYQIYNNVYIGDLQWIHLQCSLQYFQTCSNYQYKEHIPHEIQKFKKSKMNHDELMLRFSTVSPQKQTLFSILLIQNYLTESEISLEHFTQFVLRFFKQLSVTICTQELVLKELCKVYFLKYLKNASRLIQILPKEVIAQIESFWQQKSHKTGQLFTTKN